jgi:hypothetical protein
VLDQRLVQILLDQIRVPNSRLLIVLPEQIEIISGGRIIAQTITESALLNKIE